MGNCTVSGSNKALTLYNGNTPFSYRTNETAWQLAYYSQPIDATNFRNLILKMTWQSLGNTTDPTEDYAKIIWSLDGVNFSYASPTYFSNQNGYTTGYYELSPVDDQIFYIGFEWYSTGNSNSNDPPMTIDSLEILGKPVLNYNFTYRNDFFKQIVGTILDIDANDGVNIALPSDFTFIYDGMSVTSLRANINGWLEMGTTHTANAETNELTSPSETPIVAPFWDDLQTDYMTRLLYNVSGTAPTRIVTIEWRDVLWGGKRQNFQVKLYETSNIIEFWYGTMNVNSSGSASIGINNTGSCMNKFMSIYPAAVPIFSRMVEKANISNEAKDLTYGKVYVFNPLQMQEFHTWEAMDIVVGQVDEVSTSTSCDQVTSSGANSTAISSTVVLAVGSSFRNRVLLWDTLPESNGVPADVVIGQDAFNNFGAGLNNWQLNTPYYVAFSPDGKKLLVADAGNNRVLIWNNIPTSNAQPADVVIGQSVFTTNLTGCSRTRLKSPTGILVLPDGRLLIVDRGNNRVLIYNKIPESNLAEADVIIGQDDFYSYGEGITANRLVDPWDCAYTPDGRLLVSDGGDVTSGAHRILVFNDVPKTNGVYADVVIGNNNFTYKPAGCNAEEFNQPSISCSIEGKMAVADFGNSRVVIFNSVPAYNKPIADLLLGQPHFYVGKMYNNGWDIATTSADERNMYIPYSINFDLNGRLYVNGTATDGTGMNRVMVFGNKPTTTADLEVSITTTTPEVCVYGTAEYAVTVTNKGPDDAFNVFVNAQLPYGMEPLDYDASLGSIYNQKTGYWYLPYLASGTTSTLTFTGYVTDQLKGSTAVSYAFTAGSSQKDIDYTNNASTITVDVGNGFAPIISEISDTSVARNSHVLIPFKITDYEGYADIFGYTALSSDTTIVPIDYVNNIIFGGTEPEKNVDIYPATDKYGYVDMTVIATDNSGCTAKQTFQLAVGNIWEGDDPSTPRKWDVAENWSVKVPTTVDEAIIPTIPKGGNFPLVDIYDAVCYDLIIEPRASVTLANGYGLDMTNNVYINSNETGTGSFVDLNPEDSSNIGNTILVEQYTNTDRWNYISSPLVNMPNNAITDSNCNVYNGNVIYFNEAYNADTDGDGDIDWFDGWVWPWLDIHNSDPLIPGKGYAYYSWGYSCDPTLLFTGENMRFNSGDIAVTITNQDETQTTDTNLVKIRGWNLVGNPYPSGINIDSFMNDPINSTLVDATIYFWDEPGSEGWYLDGRDYASYNPFLGATVGKGSGSILPDRYLSINQGFYVHRTNTDVAGSDIYFRNSMRNIESSTFFKAEEPKSQLIPRVKFAFQNDNYYNETIIGFANDASADIISSKYDGLKIEGNEHISLYTIKNGNYFINQAIRPMELVKDTLVPVGFKTDELGEHLFTLKFIDNVPEDVKITLIDKYLDKEVDLRVYREYKFQVTTTGRNDDRFIIKFSENIAPYVANNIGTIDVYEDEFSMIKIPADAFIDPDNDELVYEIKTLDGKNIPSYMRFDNNTKMLYIIPSNDEVGIHHFILKATDPYNKVAQQEFDINVINVNDPPMLVNPIGDFKIYAGQNWMYKVPTNTFTDIDLNDQLKLSLDDFITNPFINFDNIENVFTAFPSNNDAGVHIIRLNATDLSYASTFTTFSVEVIPTLIIDELNTNYTIYPNPSDGHFEIKSDNEEFNFEIINTLGQKVTSGKSAFGKANIDMNLPAAGVYYVKLYQKDKLVTIPIVIQ